MHNYKERKIWTMRRSWTKEIRKPKKNRGLNKIKEDNTEVDSEVY
jgi:hypothetical protein